MPHLCSAQATTSFGMGVGISNVYYRNTEAPATSMGSYFLPTFQTELKKCGENFFYGSLIAGITPRIMAFHQYEDGSKMGVQAPELFAAVKVGIQAGQNYLTHQPYLALGVGKLFDANYYSGNQYGTVGLGEFRKDYIKFNPYLEIGNTFLNASYRTNRRSVFMTFGFRYYPTPWFRERVFVEYDFNTTKYLQFQVFELIMSAGLQRNYHRE